MLNIKKGDKMNPIKFWDEKIKKMNTIDVGLIKLAVAGFTLMLAKLWSPLLSLEWYWYGIIFLLAGITVMYKTLK